MMACFEVKQMPYTKVKGHYARRNGKRYYVKPHTRKTVGSKAQGRSGEKFKRLASEVAAEYRKKGYSAARAQRIGEATAGKVFWQKYGRRSGGRILRRER